jgi:hypothetical protein
MGSIRIRESDMDAFSFNDPFNAIYGGVHFTQHLMLQYDNGLLIAPPNAVVVTPLPAALPLFATSLGVLGLMGWRRKWRKMALGVAGCVIMFAALFATPVQAITYSADELIGFRWDIPTTGVAGDVKIWVDVLNPNTAPSFIGQSYWSLELVIPDIVNNTLTKGVFFEVFSPYQSRQVTPVSFHITESLTSLILIFGSGQWGGAGCCGLYPGLPTVFLQYDGNLLVLPSNFTVVTPLPAALPLFATGLGVLGLLGWRRKRKAAALAA